MNVPVRNGSVVDLVCWYEKKVTHVAINEVVRTAAATDRWRKVVKYENEPIVSSDVSYSTYSSTFDSLATMVQGERVSKTLSWYDAGYGYAHRAVELISRFAELDRTAIFGGGGGGGEKKREGRYRMTIRVGINGFGRIGRTVFRILSDRDDVEIAAINDLYDNAHLAYLLKYDTIMRVFHKEVSTDRDTMTVDGKKVRMIEERDPSKIPWRELGMDVVVEATGILPDGEKLQRHITAGAKKVILTVPAKDEVDAMVVVGVNDGPQDGASDRLTRRARRTASRRWPRCSTRRSGSEGSSRPCTPTRTTSAWPTSPTRTCGAARGERTSSRRRPARRGRWGRSSRSSRGSSTGWRCACRSRRLDGGSDCEVEAAAQEVNDAVRKAAEGADEADPGLLRRPDRLVGHHRKPTPRCSTRCPRSPKDATSRRCLVRQRVGVLLPGRGPDRPARHPGVGRAAAARFRSPCRTPEASPIPCRACRAPRAVAVPGRSGRAPRAVGAGLAPARPYQPRRIVEKATVPDQDAPPTTMPPGRRGGPCGRPPLPTTPHRRESRGPRSGRAAHDRAPRAAV